MSLVFSNFLPHLVSLVIFLFIIVFFSLFLCFIIFTRTSRCALILKFSFSGNLNFSLPFLLDFYSIIFALLVCRIACIVIVFAGYYIGTYTSSVWFMVLLCSFVFSMLLLIILSDMIFLMLGWDGLGLVSFILILFYETPTCTYSSLLTLLTNRLGDSIFLLLISILLLNSSFSRFDLSLNSVLSIFDYTRVNFLLVFLIILGSITKSAFFPFSSWLPAAMAAPTPISALVHSSTLVTAGLYLFIRFYPLLSISHSLVILILFLRLLTSLVAGCSTIAELDLKKLVALSTLSHLGFIGISIFSGALSLAFLHLFSHALFKSLLFVSVGGLILVVSHTQDARLLSFSSRTAPFSSALLVVSRLRLLGLPFSSGFYSKDFILESLYFRNLSIFFLVLAYFNVALRFFYSFKIIFFNRNFFSYNSFIQPSAMPLPFLSLTLLVSFFSVIFSPIYFLVLGAFPFTFIVPSFIKFTPFIILFFVLSLLVLFFIL